MGLQTTLTFTCDYSGCKGPTGGPLAVSWCQEAVQKDESLLPEEGKYLVMFNQNGVLKTYCCQLHAAESFLPPGYEAKQKQVIELPVAAKQEEVTPPWLRRKPVEPCTVISRSESDPIPQPDGYSGPENGLEGVPV